MTMRHRNGLSLTLAGIISAAAFVGGCDTSDTTTTSGTSTSGTSASGTSGGTASTSPAAGATTTSSGTADTQSGAQGGAQADASAKQATATLEPSKAPGEDNVAGTVTFTPAGKGLRVKAEVTGLTPNGKHGFHIHEKGDLSAPDFASAGGHFNPGGHKHGGPDTSARHAGDLGNLQADASGKATYDQTIEGLSIDDAKTGVVGKSVIVHGKADDLKTDPAGDSGPRIAGGVIKAGGSGGAGGADTAK